MVKTLSGFSVALLALVIVGFGFWFIRGAPGIEEGGLTRSGPAPERASDAENRVSGLQSTAGADAEDVVLDIRSLQQELQSQQSRIAVLEARLQQLENAATPAMLERQLSDIDPTVDAMVAPLEAMLPNRSAPADETQQRDWLLAAGVAPERADALLRRESSYALQRLELIDQAAREGREHDPAVAAQLAELEQQRGSLRDALGEQTYAEYLRQSGRPDRVRVVDLISGGAAGDAGITAGDVLLRYDNIRIFSIDQLQSLTRSGVRGEAVSVELDRAGVSLLATVPRGPLGVSLMPVRGN